MADAPAARYHILRPHHVLMAAILRLTHTPEWSPADAFLMKLYRLVVREISDIYKPLPYRDILRRIKEFDEKSFIPGDAGMLELCLNTFLRQAVNSDFLMNLDNQLDGMVFDRTDLTSSGYFEKRSYFGMFIRRTRLSLHKLSYEGLVKLVDDFQGWATATHMNGYVVESSLPAQGLLIHPTSDDNHPYGTSQTLADSEAAEYLGDPTAAAEYLRRFFSQRFSEEADSGFNQYALLRLASTHYLHGETQSAKAAIEEAMKVCRNTGDRYTLISCTALWRRITAFYPDHEPAGLRKGFRQLEVLWDLRRSLESGEPISKCWKFVWQASAGAKDLSDGGKARDRANLNTAYSLMWRLSGIGSLGKLWEDISLLNMDESPEDTRLTNILARTSRLVRMGKYDDAWATLLDPTTWRPLSLSQIHQWQWELWCHLITFSIRSDRKGLNEYLRRSMPPYPTQQNYHGRQISMEKGDLGVWECLRKGHAYISNKNYLLALSPVLTAATLSEYSGNWHMHRTTMIMIADIGIAMGMAANSYRLLDEHMPQILRGDDLEQRAYACFTMGRCLIALAEGNPLIIQDSVAWLNSALDDYEAIDVLQSCFNVLYTLAVVYENTGKTEQRDGIVNQLRAFEEAAKKRRSKAVDQKYVDIIDMAGKIVAYVASGGRKADVK